MKAIKMNTSPNYLDAFPQAVTELNQTTTSSTAGKRILLVDDEMHILRAAEFKLKRSGYEIECVEDGQQAWEAIQEQMPDLLITDFHMPRLDGLGLCRLVREDEATRQLPIIMLTAKGFEMTSDDNLESLEIAAILAKPFSPRGLVNCVEAVLTTGSFEQPPISYLR
ncbi:Response regulator (CheY-like receiver domain and DNA-binding HTHdomain) [Blastopirellula marina DSM 3645]|uniref:Response regulator (CheY-like receiver domain and DNA-binding HTHdomain) n=2 Tax=Blastopirellula marina TaxID=124 RepID=A3ZUP8_9BACT|nr:Response regulator (CheY-like receiver domain and DNA-binding HTHdomain) [Blastopirellula marina DSM 3645]